MSKLIEAIRAWNGDSPDMLKEAAIALVEKHEPCPYIVTGKEGTSYCQLAEQNGAPVGGEAVAELDRAFCAAYSECVMDAQYPMKPVEDMVDSFAALLRLYRSTPQPAPQPSAEVVERVRRALSYARHVDELTPGDLERHGGYETVNFCIGHSRDIATELEASLSALQDERAGV